MEELLAQYYAEQRQALVDQATCLLHGDRMAAEDVVQTTFLRLLSMSHPCQFRFNSVAALVHTTMLNLLRDLWRRRQHRQAYERNLTIDMGMAHADDVFSICSASQITELLEHKLARMDDTVANIVRMNLFKEKPVSEISETLGIKYKTIENHLQTGRRQLRQYLRKVV